MKCQSSHSNLLFSHSSLKLTTVLKFQSSPTCLYFYCICLDPYIVNSICCKMLFLSFCDSSTPFYVEFCSLFQTLYIISLNKAIIFWLFPQIESKAASVFHIPNHTVLKICLPVSLSTCMISSRKYPWYELLAHWTCSFST